MPRVEAEVWMMSDDNSKRRRGVFRVAADAGVSIATVSRTFNEPELVREDLRKRVLEAAAMVGYVPNSAAKALRLQRTHIVGAVIPTLDHAIYAKLVNAFQNQVAQDGYTAFVLTVGFDNSNIHAGIKQLVERGAEALMIVGKIMDDDLLRFLKIKKTPWIQTYSLTPGSDYPSVGFDNGAAIQQAVIHLLELGHRKFAMIAGPIQGNDRQLVRIKAFNDILAANGVPGPCPVVESTYTLQGGFNALQSILRDHPATTAIVCSSDILAFGVFHACRDLGLAIPRDISVTGFDDLDFAAMLQPPLTTIMTSADEMGRIAGQHIVATLETGTALKSACLQTRLIVRQSTAPPRS